MPWPISTQGGRQGAVPSDSGDAMSYAHAHRRAAFLAGALPWQRRVATTLADWSHQQRIAREERMSANRARWSGIEVRTSYLLTPQASRRLEPLCCTPTGVIQLDGRVLGIDLEHDRAELQVDYLSRDRRSPPVHSLLHFISREDIERPLGFPCTAWSRWAMERCAAFRDDQYQNRHNWRESNPCHYFVPMNEHPDSSVD